MAGLSGELGRHGSPGSAVSGEHTCVFAGARSGGALGAVERPRAGDRYDGYMKPPIILHEPPKRARTEYRIGLSAWMDKSMLEEGQFYPRKTMAPDERLWWYAQYFDVVEVNSSSTRFHRRIQPARGCSARHRASCSA